LPLYTRNICISFSLSLLLMAPAIESPVVTSVMQNVLTCMSIKYVCSYVCVHISIHVFMYVM